MAAPWNPRRQQRSPVTGDRRRVAGALESRPPERGESEPREPQRHFLKSVRARLRLVWGIASVQKFGPSALAGLAIILLIGWLGPWTWPTRLVQLAVAALAVVALVAFVRLRIGWNAAARAADRGLQTKDTLATSLAFAGADGPMIEPIHQRADTLAQSASAKVAIPSPWVPRRLALVAALSLIVGFLAFGPNPQADAIATRKAEAAQRDDLAEELERAADKLDPSDPLSKQAAEELRRTAKEVRSGDLERTEEAAAQAEEALKKASAPNAASQNAAVSGLEKSLAENPLGKGDTAAEQLASLAEEIAALSDEEKAALAERLAELAESQKAGNPELAEQLEKASQALKSGDAQGAADALSAAAAAQQAAAQASQQNQAVGQARGALDSVMNQVSNAANGAGRPGGNS
ncbi:MAG: hypothetical protein KA110_12390, partial [Acidimicrobiia bacterium]|nr:hypothetical protein [Acidimicrobiia bacterium]